MKKTILALTMMLATGCGMTILSQNSNSIQKVKYHFFTNNIPNEWNYPLVGIVNKVDGNHSSIQIGIVNNTIGNFGGVQWGLTNSVGGEVIGWQSGFINSTKGGFVGIQDGFINSTSSDFKGLQSGFINSNDGANYGIQTGFINSSEQVTGIQTGFINSTEEMIGLQCGFVNSAKTLRGLQLGFINSVDNVEKGLPIGFLSFVKNGGYKAIEVAYNTVSPVNISFKTGIREFYTYPMLAYDWRLDDDRLSFGYGIGSNLDLNQNLFINPELEWLHQVSLDFNHYTTLKCNLGYNIGNHLEIIAGPALVWHVKIDADDYHQNYTEWDPTILSTNKVNVGFNAAIRYRF